MLFETERSQHPPRGNEDQGRDWHECERNLYPLTFFDQERKRRTRSGDAPEVEGQSVVIRAVGVYRSRCERGHDNFRAEDGGQRGGLSRATAPAARRRAQTVVRRWLTAPDRGDPASRTEGSGNDRERARFEGWVDELQLAKKRSEASVHSRVKTSIPRPQTHLRLRQSA